MKETIKSEYEIRRQKLDKLKALNIPVYPECFKKTHQTEQVAGSQLGDSVIIAGRIVNKRTIGKITFIHILDDSGKAQAVLQANEIGEQAYNVFTELVDLADFVGIEGTIFKTKKGEISVLCKRYTFLGKALRPLPEKWHGLKDQELSYRQRYLDLIANPDTKKRFELRSRFIRLLREFYWSQGFVEIETPILANTASGALAKPFQTHHNALDIDLYLRISCGELWQKMAIIGSFEKIFELGKVFRNEGIDPSHLQEFTMLEHYCAYWNFQDNIEFTQKLFSTLLKNLFGTLKIKMKDRQGHVKELDFTPPYPTVSFRELLKQDTGLDIHDYPTADELSMVLKKKKLLTPEMKGLGRGNLIDELYKSVSRQKLTGPIFLMYHPLDVSPLARTNDHDPSIVDRFQLVVNGWEIVNAYSELVDPIDQAQRFASQTQAKKSGDADAHGEDTEYVTSLEHGAPPISGWGMGIDRIVALLTEQDNLRDLVLFPILRPS